MGSLGQVREQNMQVKLVREEGKTQIQRVEKDLQIQSKRISFLEKSICSYQEKLRTQEKCFRMLFVRLKEIGLDSGEINKTKLDIEGTTLHLIRAIDKKCNASM